MACLSLMLAHIMRGPGPVVPPPAPPEGACPPPGGGAAAAAAGGTPRGDRLPCSQAEMDRCMALAVRML